jgi:prepilin-type N-terminal cleavage/methylation domain-containing protein
MRLRSAGFTLIELMIVVFIIGIMTAAVVIAFGGDRRDTELDKEAQRLDALFDYVREQAELQTRDYGFRMNDRRIHSSYSMCCKTNGGRLMKTTRCANERFPKTFGLQWSSKAEPWCSARRNPPSTISNRRS